MDPPVLSTHFNPTRNIGKRSFPSHPPNERTNLNERSFTFYHRAFTIMPNKRLGMHARYPRYLRIPYTKAGGELGRKRERSYLYFLSMLNFWYIFVSWSHYLVCLYPLIIPKNRKKNNTFMVLSKQPQYRKRNE